jgi:hypothetical protein
MNKIMNRHIVITVDYELFEAYLELIEEPKVGAPRHEHEVASIINKPTNQADTSTDTP